MNSSIRTTFRQNFDISVFMSIVMVLITVFWITDKNWAGIASFVAAGITLSICIFTSELANDRMFKELFTLFNHHYDQLNENLERIAQSEELQSGDKHTLIDYFNLCAVEYLWYRKDRIFTDNWEAWTVSVAQMEEMNDLSYYHFYNDV